MLTIHKEGEREEEGEERRRQRGRKGGGGEGEEIMTYPKGCRRRITRRRRRKKKERNKNKNKEEEKESNNEKDKSLVIPYFDMYELSGGQREKEIMVNCIIFVVIKENTNQFIKGKTSLRTIFSNKVFKWEFY